jgi:hypothetical protein
MTTFAPVSPQEALDLYGLTKTAIVVHLYLRACDPFGNKEQIIDANELADRIGCCAASIRRAVAELVEAGLLTIGRAVRRAVNAAIDIPLKLAAQKSARAINPDHPRSKKCTSDPDCTLEAPKPLPQAEPAIAHIKYDQSNDQIKESAGAGDISEPEPEPRYIQWLLNKARSLPRPPELIFQWVSKQMSNPLTLADYRGDTQGAIALLGGKRSALPPNTSKLPPNNEDPMLPRPNLRVVPGGQAPAIAPHEHLARMSTKWRIQASPLQRSQIVAQIAANPDWGLVCTIESGPSLAPVYGDFAADEEVAF